MFGLCGDDPNLKVLMLPPHALHRTINALTFGYCCFTEISERRFWSTVTEALWKGKWVIGVCGGITLQVHDYHMIFSLFCAEPPIECLFTPLCRQATCMGRTGHDFVREHFLLHVRDYLAMLLCLDHPEPGVIVV